MPFTSVQDVRDLAPYVNINAQSQPSEGVVQRWIGEFESVLNAELGVLGYQTPLVYPANIAWAKEVVAHRVMARVMRARPNPESNPETFQVWADLQMKRLRDPADPFELRNEVMIVVTTKESGNRVHSNLAALDDGARATRTMKF